MKKIRIIILSLLLYSASGYGQEIIGREYFFDTDHGAGTGTAQSFTASDSVTDNITFSTTGLSLGFHRIYTRYHYNTGSWGIPEDRLFYIYDSTTPPAPPISPNISTGEYFFDTDPGVGHGTAVAAFTAGDSVQQTITFSTVGLGVGFHRIYTRYHDPSNNWGIAEDRLFYIYDTTTPVLIKQAPIVSGEYFFDNEPGPGNGTLIAVNPAQDSVQQTLTISAGSLALGIHYVYIRYKDANGKWGIAQPLEFQVCTPPAASIVAVGDTTFCGSTGGSVTLQADTTHGFSYQWQNNNVNLPGDTASTLVVRNISGPYDAIVTNGTGCSAASNIININAGPATPVITYSSNSNILSTQPGYTYKWYYSADSTTFNQVPGANSDSLTITQDGYYYVQVTDANQCSASSATTSYLYLFTGISQIVDNISIAVYPNPASDMLMLQSDALNNAKTALVVYDVTGKLVNTQYESVADKIKLHTGALVPSLYIITLKVNEEQVSLRFVKE